MTDNKQFSQLIIDLFNLSPSATAVFNINNGSCLISNRAFGTQLGYSDDELLSGKQSLHKLFSKHEDADNFINLVTNRKVIRRKEVTLADSDGRNFEALASGRTLNNPHQDYFEFSFIEISKQKKLQQALKREYARMASLIDNLTAGLFLVDTAGTISEANLALANYLQIAQEELIETDYSHLVSFLLMKAEEPEVLQQTLDSSIRRAAEKPVVEFALNLHDLKFHYELTLFPVRDDNGLPIGWGGLMQDITTLRDQSIWKLNLLSMLAKEIRSPLATIKGHTTALLANFQSWSPAMIEEFLGALDQSTDELIHKVDRNLALTLVETGQLGLRPEAITPNNLLNQAIERTANLLEHVPVEVQIPEKLPDVRVDPAQIEEVLINLIENAVQHASSPQGILIGAKRKDSHIQFFVQDYGPGIKPKEQEQLFQKFDPDNSQTGSSGLGLYIARRIVEAHGGVIGIQSPITKQQDGSRFSFKVPIMIKTPSTKPKISESIQKVSPSWLLPEKKYRVLAVDNQSDFQALYQSILAEEQFDLEIAQDGRTALEINQIEPPDLILLDAKLPDMDGISVCRQLRRWTDIPIIMVTSRSAQEDVIAALDAGADDYLIKPFIGEELLARIRAVLRRGDALKTKRDSNRFNQKGLVIDYDTREIWKRGKKITLTATEFDLLAKFSKNQRKTLTYENLIDDLWGPGSKSRHALSVHISRLRKKIESDPDNPDLIITKWGVGYVFLPK